ncbi:hypothetical protein BDQ12DRAFT_725503 [Crucibulum laeve]|uniref:Uncharacterized protein n=1 Tax=Crucibulum laeve TaxID=68775 RepID=A0A5C3LTQ9_9AGAR|nr:hypothetical protein BDQ12DRAFT_725503 [Crucibulum laeve]
MPIHQHGYEHDGGMLYPTSSTQGSHHHSPSDHYSPSPPSSYHPTIANMNSTPTPTFTKSNLHTPPPSTTYQSSSYQSPPYATSPQQGSYPYSACPTFLIRLGKWECPMPITFLREPHASQHAASGQSFQFSFQSQQSYSHHSNSPPPVDKNNAPFQSQHRSKYPAQRSGNSRPPTASGSSSQHAFSSSGHGGNRNGGWERTGVIPFPQPPPHNTRMGGRPQSSSRLVLGSPSSRSGGGGAFDEPPAGDPPF